MILITSFGEFLLYFIVIFYFHFINNKKKSVAGLFCVPYLLQESTPSGFETYKASSSGSVGKLTEKRLNPHMKSNTVRRVTLGNI